MPLVAAYHRPTSLADALDLIRRPNHVVLAGGTIVNADRAPSDVEVVDLQALGLDAVERSADRVRLGATATLADLVESALVPGLIGRAARAEAPSTLRTLATVGGTVATRDPASVLIASLLVHDGRVELARGDHDHVDLAASDHDHVDLAELLDHGVPTAAIVTGVSIDPAGAGTFMGTGRTPADVPIVAAVGRRVGDRLVLALTGVAAVPVLVDSADPTAGLDPPGDFRGSSEYRLELARVLSARVTEALA